MSDIDTQNLPHEKKELAEQVGKISKEAFGTRIPAEIPSSEIPPEWRQTLSDAKCAIVLCTPLLAYIMYQCEYIWTEEVPTAGALPHNGKNLIFVNPTFWIKTLKNAQERAFVLLHEISHIYLEHCGRQVDNSYNPQLWNIAADYNINITCSGVYKDEHGSVHQGERYARFVKRPELCLYDERFIGMSADAIYHQLIEENDNSVQKALEAHGMAMPDENGEPQGGSGNANGQMPLDEVSSVGPGKDQKMKNRHSASAAVASASQTNGVGDAEGDLIKQLRDIAKPKVDWRDELANSIMSSTKERPTYNRLSRRTSGDVKFPSLTGHKVKGVFGVDSSGSMGEKDYADAAGELSGLLDQFEAWELDLVTCDTRAHHIGRYASEDGDDFTSIELEFRGGGGTIMQGMADFAQEVEDEEGDIAFCIILTDGYLMEDDLKGLNDEITHIVVVTSNGNKNYANEEVRVIHMDDLG